jgi:uncharacterized protein YxeA
MKKALAVLVALLVTLGAAGVGLAQDAKGTVTKVEAKKITVKDEKGKETTVEVKATAGAKKGDMVEIKGGAVKILKKAAGY